MGAAVVVCMRSSSVCEVNALHCRLVSSDVWVGDGDTCRASTRGTEKGDDMGDGAVYVWDIREICFILFCDWIFNKELNQLKQRNERNEWTQIFMMWYYRLTLYSFEILLVFNLYI